MAKRWEPDWPTCEQESCVGVQLDAGGRCLSHTAADDAARSRWFDNLQQGQQLDARGLTLTGTLLQELLAHTPRNQQGSPRLFTPDFTRATFESDAQFDGATFAGDARFDEATFEGDTGFDAATFEGNARFYWATFQGVAVFDGATFRGDARFDWATFKGDAVFVKAIVRGLARFHSASFRADALLAELLVEHSLDLSRSRFASRLDLEVGTGRVDCRRTRLTGGGRLRAGWADVDLAEAEVLQPCILEDGAGRLRAQDGLWDRLGCQPPPAEVTPTVRLVSLQRATVTGLVLGAIDLTGCRFAGAHNLDQLRVPHTAQLQSAPPGPARRWLWARWPGGSSRSDPRSSATHRRRVVAEEIVWRQEQRWPWACTEGGGRLRPPWWWLPHRLLATLPQARYGAWGQLQVIDAGNPAEVLDPIDIAELYRALRKGREESGDEPGAADFYYGEMEMRRKSKSTAWLERVILGLYWALSGYALRASRALGALAVVILVSTIVLVSRGYADPASRAATFTGRLGAEAVEVRLESPLASKPGWDDAFWASVEAVVLRSPEDRGMLTTTGRRLTTVLRFVGPILLGLAVLSIRGRVKR